MILNQTQCHVAVTTAAYAPMPSKKSSTKRTVIMTKEKNMPHLNDKQKTDNLYVNGTKENATTLIT